jgi:hypothetical protein
VGDSEVRGILESYKRVMEASWPQLHPMMAVRSRRWPSASDAELEGELAGYITEASKPDCNVRVFWKLGGDFVFGGCNEQFAHDAGIARVELIGLTDFDRRIPWRMQAAKYRADDQKVAESGEANLDIVERQASSSGLTWVRAGKAPIRSADGKIIGVLGMYELLDAETGRKLYGENLLKKKR